MRESSIDVVYVLGAGASLSAGYPLAAGVADALQTFVVSLADRQNCRRLHELGEEILRLMIKRGCRTIDELAFVVRGTDRGHLVFHAKAVMTAFFLDLERTADLTKYRRAVRTMVDLTDLALPPDGEMRVPTRAVCINYNYDRCLPAAMYREIVDAGRGPGAETDLRVQRLLNAGMNTMSERLFPIDLTRFADLRMHGLVGKYLDDLDRATPLRGHSLDDFGRVPISDSILSAFEVVRGELPSTMIFFPWETYLPQHLQHLTEDTNRAAASFLSRAREIRMVGYSMSELNAQRLDRLLENARACRVVTVWDPSSEMARRVETTFSRVGLSPRVIHYPAWEP